MRPCNKGKGPDKGKGPADVPADNPVEKFVRSVQQTLDEKRAEFDKFLAAGPATASHFGHSVPAHTKTRCLLRAIVYRRTYRTGSAQQCGNECWALRGGLRQKQRDRLDRSQSW